MESKELGSTPNLQKIRLGNLVITRTIFDRSANFFHHKMNFVKDLI